ncbi:hypothetical protein Hanom_Chr12g01115351 [Helianthus anomalus]
MKRRRFEELEFWRVYGRRRELGCRLEKFHRWVLSSERIGEKR